MIEEKYKRPTIFIDNKQKLISRVTMEKYIGRKLKTEEIIHHKNGDTFDNKIENLLLTNRSEHKKIHNEIGIKTRLKKKYYFNQKEIIDNYLKYKSCAKVAEIYGCQEMTIERELRKALHINSLREFAKEKRWKYGNKWRNC